MARRSAAGEARLGQPLGLPTEATTSGGDPALDIRLHAVTRCSFWRRRPTSPQRCAEAPLLETRLASSDGRPIVGKDSRVAECLTVGRGVPIHERSELREFESASRPPWGSTSCVTTCVGHRGRIARRPTPALQRPTAIAPAGLRAPRSMGGRETASDLPVRRCTTTVDRPPCLGSSIRLALAASPRQHGLVNLRTRGVFA